jgi:ParB family transcriptional regulator, chromosome partitioning protein
MTSLAANWRLAHLSPTARETAEIASLGAGLSLSAWLTQVIGETCAAEGITPRSDAPTVIAFAPEKNRSHDALARPTQPVAAVVEPLVPRQQANTSANMLSVGAMAPADLGTRTDDATPEALVADIAKRGVRQALLVRRSISNTDRFEIICGHRRWRAAQRIGLARIPATICTHDDAQAILASLSENMALGDLSALDEAQTYLRLLTRCSAEMSAITQASGRDRQHVVRAVRLLGLPLSVRQLISGGRLSSEHAYLLLDAANPEALAAVITGEQLSVDAARQRLSAGARGEVRL